MRVLPVVAAVILVFLGVANPGTASAQEDKGGLQLTVQMCVNPPVFPYPSSSTVFGMFGDPACYIASSADPSRKMTIQFDGGADGFTVTEPFAPLFWPDVSLTPGTYTLTITTPQRDGPLVSSTAVTIASDQTTSLTYTVIYPAEVGSVPPPPPVDDEPEGPADPVATPTPADEGVTDDPAPPIETDPGDVSVVPADARTVPEDAPATGAVTSLPNTGSGVIGSSIAITWTALGLASIGSVTGALMARKRRA